MRHRGCPSSRVEIDPRLPRGKIVCAAPDCAREFVFEGDEARTFEVALGLFERRYFHRSELYSASSTLAQIRQNNWISFHSNPARSKRENLRIWGAEVLNSLSVLLSPKG